MNNAEMHADANGEIEAAHDAHDTRRRVFAIVASASGNLVEWYDFYVYSFGALYFASQFSAEDQTSQLLNAAAILRLVSSCALSAAGSLAALPTGSADAHPC